MANTITQKVKWNGVWVMAVTDTDSGKMSIYEEGWFYGTTIGGQKLAESNGGMDPNNYTLTRIGGIKLQENWLKANPGKSIKDFNSSFHTTGRTAFNNLRADRINEQSDQGIIKSHYDAGVAGIKNPDSAAEVNNSEGAKVSQPQQPPTGEENIGTNEGNTPKSLDNTWTEADMDPPTAPPPVPPEETDSKKIADNISNIGGDVVKVGGNPGAYYKYPLNLSEQFQANFDFIQLTAYDYKPPGLDTINNTNYGGDINQEQIWETYQLPMVPGKGESQATDWGSPDSANALQLAMAGHSTNLINDISWKNIQKVWGEAVGDFKSVINDENTQNAITAWFAGKAVGISGLMKRSNGMVINNNMELLFNGPNLRSFNFSWVLTPRSEDEAKQIRAIIRSLKRNGAPQRSTSNLFLKSPRVFKVKYIMGRRNEFQGTNKEHPYLNKFKPCALTGLNVDYGDGTSTTTYDGGSMTQYTIGLTLSELSPIYADEYDGDDLHYAKTMGY